MLAMPSLNCQGLSAVGVIQFGPIRNDPPSHAYCSFTDVMLLRILCIEVIKYFRKLCTAHAYISCLAVYQLCWILLEDSCVYMVWSL